MLHASACGGVGQLLKQVQMVWQKPEICFMELAVLMLIPSIFCLELIPNGKSVQSGRLIIGSSGATSQNKDDLKKLHGSQLAMLKLRRLSPSVRCDNNSMSLHIQGSRVPDFLVETSEEGPVPLFQMPSNCGFSVKRARRDLALVANYDGCNVVQQGDAYVLPLRFLGVGMKVVCPMARPISTVFCSRSAMVVSLCSSLEGLWVKVNGLWQPVHQVATCGFTLKPVGGGLTLAVPYTSSCWQYEGEKRILSVKYLGVELTLSCPTVYRPAEATLPAEGHPEMLSTPMTTPAAAVASASADQPQWYPWLHGMQQPYFKPWRFHHGAPPVPLTTVAPTTTTPAAAVASASADQPQWYPWLHGMQQPYFKPWRFNHGALPVPLTTEAPTTTPAAPASSDQQALYQWFPGWYHGKQWHFPYSHPGTPTMDPTTTTTVAPANDYQQALYHWFPRRFHGVPWYFPYSHPKAPTVTPQTTTMVTAPSTAPPATTVAPSNSDQPHLYPWLPGMINPYVPVVSSDISVSVPNSGYTQQKSWVNAFPKFPPVVNPANVLPYPAHFFPLHVKARPAK